MHYFLEDSFRAPIPFKSQAYIFDIDPQNFTIHVLRDKLQPLPILENLFAILLLDESAGPHVSQAGLKLVIWPRMIFNLASCELGL